MSDPSQQQQQTTFFSRLGNWFKRTPRNGDLPLSPENGGAIEPRSTFLRPWNKYGPAINQLQEGFGTLTELMGAIRENLDRQGKRQDELVQYLAHLPQALQSLPESSRIHGETLRAIHQQLENQNSQQEKLAQILQKLGTSGGEQKETLNEIRDNVESLRQTDEAISSNLSNLGTALQSVSQNSATGAQVLDQMRERIDTRDGQLERILQKQGTRFTTMLSIAIFLSIAALVAVGVIGYMLIIKK
jgi:ABC-type transporter Mla subunit MlaD